MASTFDGLGLFNSGPHRFSVEPAGASILVNARVDPFVPGSVAVGPLEEGVLVRGRLTAPSEPALWALRAALAARLTHPPAQGTLIDHHGRQWAGMSFVRFEAADRTDRGRVWSLAYTARFVRFLGS
jgi:hypothetical protein